MFEVVDCKTKCGCPLGGLVAVVYKFGNDGPRPLSVQPHFLRWKDAQMEASKASKK